MGISFFLVLELPHAVVGAAIATKIGNPTLALPLALASHFALDLVPHWNPHLNTEIKKYGKLTQTTTSFIMLDVGLAAASVAFIASQQLPETNAAFIVLLGGLMGILPDLLEAPYFFLRFRYPFVERLIKFQKSIQNDAPPLLGLSTQVVTLIAAFWWIFG